MADHPGNPNPDLAALQKENARLKKAVEALSRASALETALAENQRITRELQVSEAKFRELANQSLVGIIILEDDRFTYTNDRFCEMFGYSADELRRVDPLDMVAEHDRPTVAENMRRRIAGEAIDAVYGFQGLRKDGSAVQIEIHASTMELDGKRVLISVLLDVTERLRAERETRVLQQKLAEQSVHDALTGLYNRRYLDEALTRELALAERKNHPISFIMADLDHFKKVNDQYGHLAGDEVLRAFAAMLKRSARASDIYCRYGGEEFLLVLPQMSLENAAARAEQLRRTLAAAPIRYGATAIPITASFGVAAFPDNGRIGDRIIDAADKALYEAKNRGRNRVHLSEVKAAA